MFTTFESTTTDIYDVYQRHARLHDDGKVKMRGKFQAAHLPDHTYSHIFQPDDNGDLTHVIPIYDGCRVVDVVAISGDCWGCVSGAGKYLGTITGRVYDSISAWMAGDEVGALPLKKSFLA